MVGARNASASGQRIAGKLTKDIGARGLILVSGLARGIDREAHQSALEAGTIAVIANGIDHSYPRENAELQKQIYEQGLILCENPPGTDRNSRRHYGSLAAAHRKHGVENTGPENAKAPTQPACTGQRRNAG